MEDGQKITITFKEKDSCLYDVEITGIIQVEQLWSLAADFRYQGTIMREAARIAQIQAMQSRDDRNKIKVPDGVIIPDRR